MTIDAAIAKYAPSFENNTAAYQDFINNSLGVSGNTIIRNLSPQQFNTLVNGIRSVEGWQPGSTTHVEEPGE